MHRTLASCFGLGLIPRALWGSDNGAGTFGAAFGTAIALGLLVGGASWWVTLAVALAVTALALRVSQPFAADHQDPGWICIDEAAGAMIALVGLGGWPFAVAAVVARGADIFKVLPGVRWAEQLPGAWGVVLDDVVAGLYGLAVGWVLVAAGL